MMSRVQLAYSRSTSTSMYILYKDAQNFISISTLACYCLSLQPPFICRLPFLCLQVVSKFLTPPPVVILKQSGIAA